MHPKISALIFKYYAQYSTYAGPSCHWLDWESLGTSHGVSQSCSRVSWCSSPANHMPLGKGNLYYAITSRLKGILHRNCGNRKSEHSVQRCKLQRKGYSYTEPSPCILDCWTAQSDAQIRGEESQTQPGYCSRLRPNPSSSWCHYNRDDIQTHPLSIAK